MPSYHDLHITTATIPRTSIFNLPYRVRVHCARVSGWEVWALQEGVDGDEFLGGEYGGEKWLRLDVGGHVICDSEARAAEFVARAGSTLREMPMSDEKDETVFRTDSDLPVMVTGQPKYICSDHGVVEGGVFASNIKGHEGQWCMACFVEMVAAHCRKVTQQ